MKVHIGVTTSCLIKLKEPAVVPGRGHYRLSVVVIFLFKKEFIMAKSDFIPSTDNGFSVWLDRFTSNLSARIVDFNLSESDLAPLKTDVVSFHGKIAATRDAAVVSNPVSGRWCAVLKPIRAIAQDKATILASKTRIAPLIWLR